MGEAKMTKAVTDKQVYELLKELAGWDIEDAYHLELSIKAVRNWLAGLHDEPRADAQEALKFYAERRHLLPSADEWTFEGNKAYHEPGDLQITQVEDGSVARAALNRSVTPEEKSR